MNLFLPHSCRRKGPQSAAYVSVRVVVLLRPFILIGFLSAATGALAEPVPLEGDALQEAVAGSVVEIDTPLGTKVPMRFGKDGLVSAEAGVLAPVLGSAKDRGRWWIDSDKLCTKWFRWFEAGVRCLTIRQDGARIYWRKIDDGETGTGTLVDWTPPAEKSVAVAKAEPASRRAPEPRETPLSREEKVAALPAPEAPVAQATPEPSPTVVALPDSLSTSKDRPIMHFGGTGLLEASARVGLDAEATGQAADADVPAPKRPPAHARAKEVARAAGKDDGAAAAQRSAALDVAAAPKRDVRRPPFSAATWDEPAATAAAGVLYRVTGVHRSDVLNVRRGPSEQHAQVGSIPPTGRKVQITGACRADWCPIRYGRITGWVNSYYLAEESVRRGSASRVYVARP